MSSVESSPYDLEPLVLDAISLDITALERGVDLWSQPLWLDDTPEWAVRGWETLATELTRRAPYWKTLVRWYEDRLHGDEWAASQGRPAIPELEISCASLPERYWKKGGRAVNEAIAALEAYYWDGAELDDPDLRTLVAGIEADGELQPEDPPPVPPIDTPIAEPEPPPISAIPAQIAAAVRFTDDPNKPIDLAAPTPEEAMLDTPGRREDYAELRRKLLDLQSESDNTLGRLKAPVAAFLALGDDLARIRNTLFLSRFNPLRAASLGHDSVLANEERRRTEAAARGDRSAGLHDDPDPRRLDGLAAEKLKDIVGTGNIYIFDEPRLFELDQRRPGPQETSAARAEIAAIAPTLRQAAGDPALMTPEAGEAVLEALDSTRDGGDSLPDRQATEMARDTTRNAFTAILRSAYRWGRDTIGKDVVSGALREVGKKLLDAALDYIPPAGKAAAHYVAENASELIAYTARVYHSDDLMAIIHWIAALF